jgi:low affinity Fe/Cu permease
MSAYSRFSSALSTACGHPMALALAFAAVIIWAIIGPFAGFSETWQLTINTGTTIITFLMVFVIQSSQNRDTRALHIKLDELIRINSSAKNDLLNLEGLSESELAKIQKRYQDMAEKNEEARERKPRAPKKLANAGRQAQ